MSVLVDLFSTKVKEPSFKSVCWISEKRGGVSNQKSHPLKVMQECKRVVSLFCLFNHLCIFFLVKAIYCVKDLIMVHR